jgi:hypothetical protein
METGLAAEANVPLLACGLASLTKAEICTVSGRHLYFHKCTEHISTGTGSWPAMCSGQSSP